MDQTMDQTFNTMFTYSKLDEDDERAIFDVGRVKQVLPLMQPIWSALADGVSTLPQKAGAVQLQP